MTAEVAKQGLTRIPTYAELIKEIDKEKIKTSEIRRIFDRNAWHFFDSPQGQALNTNNIHPADLQQQNFKRMVEEATRMKEEETQTLDVDDITDLREDAVSDFEMSFDKERELREENERRIAEQVNMSHAQDHYQANRGAYDSVGASASAGIQEEEEQPSSSSSRRTLKKVLKSAKPVIKAVATATGKSKGGDIGGLIASKLTDVIIPDDEEMPEKKEENKVEVMKPKGRKKTTEKQRKRSKQDTKPDMMEEPNKKAKPEPKKKAKTEPKPKALPTINVQASSSSNDPKPASQSNDPNPEETKPKKNKPKLNIEENETSSVKKTINKQKAIAPSVIGIQVLREKFEEANNAKTISSTDYANFKELFEEWKSSKGNKEKKTQHVKTLRKLYKEVLYNKIK